MVRPWWDAQLIVLGCEKMLAAFYLDDQLANFDFDVLCLIDVEVLRGLARWIENGLCEAVLWPKFRIDGIGAFRADQLTKGECPVKAARSQR